MGQSHFGGRVDFLDLFLRTEFSSASRAQAFLWLCFNYLESPSSEDDYDEEPAPNPFSDPSKPTSPPSFELLSAEAVSAENQESEEDAETLRKLNSQRLGIVETLNTKGAGKSQAKDKASVNGSVIGEDEEMAPPPVEEPKTKGKRAVPTISLKGKGKRGPAPREKKPGVTVEEKAREKEGAGTVVEGDNDDEMLDAFLKRRYRIYFGWTDLLNELPMQNAHYPSQNCNRNSKNGRSEVWVCSSRFKPCPCPFKRKSISMAPYANIDTHRMNFLGQCHRRDMRDIHAMRSRDQSCNVRFFFLYYFGCLN